MGAAVHAPVMTEQVLINDPAEAQASQAASKGPGDSTQYSACTNTGRPGNDTHLHSNTATDQGTRRTGRSGTTDSTGNSTDRATDTLAIMGIHHPPRTAAGTDFGHSGILMRQAS